MRVLCSLNAKKLNQAGKFAAELEENGFTDASTQENKQDPFLPIAVAAVATGKIEFRTSVSIAFARSPMSSAMMSWDLQAASGGRFTLGLGSQVKGHNQRRFSVPWSPPAPRMREYVQSVRAIWDCWANGTALSYEGKHYQFSLMTPNFTPDKLEGFPPKIQISAVGPIMMNVAAEECDGVMLHSFCTRKYLLESVFPRLSAGLEKSGKKREEFEISGGGFVATGPDNQSVKKMFEWVRSRIGFYGSTPSYWPVLEAHDLKELGLKLNEMSKKGLWDKMTKEVPDDVVHLFAAVGRHDEIVSAIEDHFGGLTDIVGLPSDTPRDLVQDVRMIESPASIKID
jgi:probable F420-dependent oxidoreductase